MATHVEWLSIWDIKPPPPHQPRSSVSDVSDLITTLGLSGLFNSALNAKRYPDGEFAWLRPNVLHCVG